MSSEKVTIKEYIKQGFDSLHERLDRIESNNDLIYLKKDDYNKTENLKEREARKARIDLWIKILALMISVIGTFSFLFSTWVEVKINNILDTRLIKTEE
jgi:hypothetical protein